MRFNMINPAARTLQNPVRVGDVFKARGGRGRTFAWVVVALSGQMAYVLGISDGGEVVSSSQYCLRYLEEREPIGLVPDLEGLVLEVEMDD